jgi:hypothetical protein
VYVDCNERCPMAHVDVSRNRLRTGSVGGFGRGRSAA